MTWELLVGAVEAGAAGTDMVFLALLTCPNAVGVDGDTIVILMGKCHVFKVQEVVGGLMEVTKSLYPLESVEESEPGMVYMVRDVWCRVAVVPDVVPPAAQHGWCWGAI